MTTRDQAADVASPELTHGRCRAASGMPLCVDLDGTLLPGDRLLDSALQLLHRNPAYVFALALWWLHGRAYMKQEIARRVDIDPAHWPFRPGRPRVSAMRASARSSHCACHRKRPAHRRRGCGAPRVVRRRAGERRHHQPEGPHEGERAVAALRCPWLRVCGGFARRHSRVAGGCGRCGRRQLGTPRRTRGSRGADRVPPRRRSESDVADAAAARAAASMGEEPAVAGAVDDRAPAGRRRSGARGGACDRRRLSRVVGDLRRERSGGHGCRSRASDEAEPTDRVRRDQPVARRAVRRMPCRGGSGGGATAAARVHGAARCLFRRHHCLFRLARGTARRRARNRPWPHARPGS